MKVTVLEPLGYCAGVMNAITKAIKVKIDNPNKDIFVFGKLVQMEVGAMLVGRIVNEEPQACAVRRGAEKGHFEYGGSTVIVLVPEDKAQIKKEILAASERGEEVDVTFGSSIS